MGTVLIPIETKSREFLGKTWLALNLVNSGHDVFLGQRGPIYNRYHEFEPDLFIDKAAFYGESHIERIDEIHESGGKVVFLDEEGAIFQSPGEYAEKRSEELINRFDKIYSWGEVPARGILSHFNYQEENLEITGHPRFDLLHSDLRSIYSSKAQAIQSQFGEYVLFNTNFGTGNHHSTPADKDSEDNGDFNDSSPKYRYDLDLLDHFFDGIRQLLQSCPELNVVIRPHPSENHETYRTEFVDEERVAVEYEGDVRSWIMGSIAVVHNSCTTGIESALLETPTFAFKPNDYEGQDLKSELPNIVSHKVFTANELSNEIQTTRDSRRSYQIPDQAWNELKRYFFNIDKKAAPRITSDIDAIIEDKVPTQFSDGPKAYSSWDNFKKSPYGSALKTLKYTLFGEPITRRKFEGIALKEIQEIINEFSNVTNLPKVSVEKGTRWEDIYLIK